MSDVKLSKRAEAVLWWIRKPHPPAPSPATGEGESPRYELAIRQQTLADLLGCSRRSIYRALKQLKEQGYLVETGKRQKRCKVYEALSKCRSYRAQTTGPTLPGPCEPRLAATQATSLVALRASKLPEAPKVSKELAAWTEEGRRYDAGPGKGGQTQLCEQAKFYLDNCRNVFRYNFPEDFDWEKHFPEATHKIRHVEHQTKFWRLMFDNLYLIQERETGKPNGARINNPDSTLFGVPYPKVPPPSQIDTILKTRPSYRPYQPKR